MSAYLSVGERWRVIFMKLDQCMNAFHIGSVINSSQRTVYNISDLFRETSNVIERSGRDAGNSLTADEPLVRLETIEDFSFHPVHARTQPSINKEHAQQRLLFSERHIDHDWSRVVFSDEKAFEVDLSGIVYWIPYGRSRPTSFTSQIQFDIAVFGAVWYNSKSDLVLIQGRTNTATFVEYLQTALHSHHPPIKNYSFIHDRPRWAHTSSAQGNY